MNVFKSSLFVAAAFVLFAACERQDQELDQTETTAALGEAETSALFDDLDTMTAEAVLLAEAEGERNTSTQGAIPGCAAISRDANSRTITLDFGTGCTDARGNVRSGKISITRTGYFFQPGSTITTTLAGYTFNGIAVAGTRVLENVTPADSENLRFSVRLSGGRVSWPDGSVAEREVQHLRTWVRAANPANDEWHISGTASGTNRQGQAYSTTITDTLVLKFSCMAEGIYAPSKGVQVITRPDKAAITLNWGSGECDRSLEVSMNGRSRTITFGR